jgi:hypothetical protein
MALDVLLKIAADADVVIGCDLVVAMIADGLYTVFGDVYFLVSAYIDKRILANTDPLIIAHRLTAVVPDTERLVMIDLFAAVIADEGGFVVFDHVVLVFLRVDKHLLPTQLILETQLIEAIALVLRSLHSVNLLLALKQRLQSLELPTTAMVHCTKPLYLGG